MAAITCTVDSIGIAAKCLQNPCITEADRMAIAVLLGTYTLHTKGGTDYRANFPALFQASVNYPVVGHSTMSAETLALTLGATTGAPSTVDAAVLLVKCIRCQSLKALRRALMFLQCAIAQRG